MVNDPLQFVQIVLQFAILAMLLAHTRGKGPALSERGRIAVLVGAIIILLIVLVVVSIPVIGSWL